MYQPSSSQSSTLVGRLAAVAIGAVVILAIFFDVRGQAVAQPPPAPGTGTPNAACLGVAIVSSQEKSALLATLAAAYDATKPKQDGRCVDVRVNTLASGAAEQALAGDWKGASGPAPTVWSPAASSWLGLLSYDRAAADRADISAATSPSLMQSPLVLAMPKPMAEALGWPKQQVGWSDVLKLAQDPAGWGRYGHPEWGRFRLGKTSPLQSTSGLHALLATYYAATGLSADLTAHDLQDPNVVLFVKGVESSVIHYGNTVSTFLDGLRTADQASNAMGYVSAIATEETEVLAYDAGRPKTPLVAVYPHDGTFVADHPYAILTAPWVSAAQGRAAGVFLKWLLAPPQQARFLRAGFRDHDGLAAPNLTIDSGILPAGPALKLQPPAPDVLALVRGSWTAVRKRARVLMVIDVSGSMDGDKLNQVKAAAHAALKSFAPDDELGLWTFSDGINRLASIAPVGNGSRLAGEIDGLQAGGGTALYDATSDAVAAVRQGWDPTRINAVMLLTDGQDNVSSTGLGDLLKSLQLESVEHPVPVFTIAYGSDADLGTLQRISSASHGRSYDAPEPAKVGSVFADVVSNF